MAVCGFEPVNLDGELVFAPPLKKLDADISVPRAVFHKTRETAYPVRLIHFSNYRTQLSFYRNEVVKLNRISRGGKPSEGLSREADMLRYFIFRIEDMIPLAKRILRKIKRMMHT